MRSDQLKPKDLARRYAATQADGFKRESFVLPRQAARERAKEVFAQFPKAAYMTEIESWQELADGRISVTMRHLPTAD